MADRPGDIGPSPTSILLTHGAGSDRDHPTLLALEAGLGPVPVERIDFPYRAAGRKGPPDRAPRLVAAIVEAHAELQRALGAAGDTIILGGRSMGGRMCSMAAAEGLRCRGLILLSYPLHPVGRPEKLRVDHFGAIGVPTLFVSGDRDPMAPLEMLRHQASAIAGPVTIHVLDGARHEPKGRDDEIVAAVRGWVETLA